MKWTKLTIDTTCEAEEPAVERLASKRKAFGRSDQKIIFP